MTENILNKKFISVYAGNLSIFLGALFTTCLLMAITAMLQMHERQAPQVRGKEVSMFIQKKVTQAPKEFKEPEVTTRPMTILTSKKPRTASNTEPLPDTYVTAPAFETSSILTSGISIGKGALAVPETFIIPAIKSDYSLTEVDKKPVPTFQAEPVYPYSAKRQGIEGIVSIRFLVTKDGEVSQLCVLSAMPQGVFEEATKKSVVRWHFSPGMINGEAVNTWVEMDIEFELDSSRS